MASQIFAKYALGNESVPTNLVNGGGIKPLRNQTQQPTTPKAPAAPKAPEAPTQPTQPAAPAIEPIPPGVPAPPVVPPPQSGLPPAKPMASPASRPVSQPFADDPFAGAASPVTPAAGTVNQSGQITGQPAPTAGQTHIENPANTGDSAQTHIDSGANAHAGITDPQAVNQPRTTGGQTPAAVDQNQFAQDLQKMPKEQALPKAKEFVQGELAKPENKQVMEGLADIKSGDPARANTPAAQAYRAAMQKAPEGLIREEYEKLIAANPDASPQQYGAFMQQAISNGMSRFQEMPLPAQIMMTMGIGAGLIGLFSSMFGEGGAESGLLGLLGMGAAGMLGANYGMFGNDARMMMGQGAVGLGRMMGMKIPDASAFTPEGIEKAKADSMQAVTTAMFGDEKNKIPKGGWQGGIKKIEELRAPLDQLANTAETYGKDFAITTLMGVMNTNDPSVAQQKFDMLMKQRQEMMDPQYLRNQMGPLATGAEFLFGKYPGEAPAQAAPPQ